MTRGIGLLRYSHPLPTTWRAPNYQSGRLPEPARRQPHEDLNPEARRTPSSGFSIDRG